MIICNYEAKLASKSISAFEKRFNVNFLDLDSMQNIMQPSKLNAEDVIYIIYLGILQCNPNVTLEEVQQKIDDRYKYAEIFKLCMDLISMACGAGEADEDFQKP